MTRGSRLVLCLLLWLPAAVVHALSIGQWSGSLRSWNSPDMSVLRGLVTERGHVVLPDAPITAEALAAIDVLVVGEPNVALTPIESVALAAFLVRGGVLIVFGDTSTNIALLNGMLASIPPFSLTFTSAGASNAPLVSGDRASQGPPADIVGASLAVTTGREVQGGSPLAGTYIHFEARGGGKLYAIGDRLDHNALVVDANSVNARLFLNLLAFGAGRAVPMPALSPVMLTALSALLGALAAPLLRRRRGR